uniref:Uncharacterized protein n=1 Tax=Meloidogyne enterolobii TaxID=390850 RepID=A0A6V7TZH0_MELEN|nr:unnamed protein product [Meloidogyne enterolobii]
MPINLSMKISTVILLSILSLVLLVDLSYGQYNWSNYPYNYYYYNPYNYNYYRPSETKQSSSDSGTSYYQYDPSSGTYKLKTANSGYYYIPGYGYVLTDNSKSSQDSSSYSYPYNYNYKNYWPYYYYYNTGSDNYGGK